MSESIVSARAGRIIESLGPFLRAISGAMDSALGPDVSDFLAGNPQELASREYVQTLQRWAEPEDKGWYGYRMAHRPAQEAAADSLSRELGIAFDPKGIHLTRGAHGALAAALSATIDPGDEVIFVSPPWFFYEAMILAADAVPVKTTVSPPSFDLDLEDIARLIAPKTRVVLLNTPHNPTGRIFPPENLKGLASLLEEASQRNGRPIYILSDEAYSRILFDGNEMVTPASFYPRSLLVHTYSKSALAPGQRIGFLALPPDMPGRDEFALSLLAMGLATSNSLPDAIMQYALADIDAMSIDLAALQAKRDRMVTALQEYGYRLHVPEATFYLLVEAPGGDGVEFTARMRRDNVLVLPGAAFEMPGYFRISLTATEDMIERALPVFEKAIKEY